MEQNKHITTPLTTLLLFYLVTVYRCTISALYCFSFFN